MAIEIAKDLKLRLPGIEASTKRNTPSSKGSKQLDINYSTPKLGLGLGVSLKSVHFPEQSKRRDAEGNPELGKYTHNVKRNDEELANEATVYHDRQPYAVMVGVFFLPFDSCSDSKTAPRNPSSFGRWVQSLRLRSGRVRTDDRSSLFEKIFIALYEPSGIEMQFFDVQSPPRKNEIPRFLLSYDAFLEEIYRVFVDRNHTEFVWDEGEVETVPPDGAA